MFYSRASSNNTVGNTHPLNTHSDCPSSRKTSNSSGSKTLTPHTPTNWVSLPSPTWLLNNSEPVYLCLPFRNALTLTLWPCPFANCKKPLKELKLTGSPKVQFPELRTKANAVLAGHSQPLVLLSLLITLHTTRCFHSQNNNWSTAVVLKDSAAKDAMELGPRRQWTILLRTVSRVRVNIPTLPATVNAQPMPMVEWKFLTLPALGLWFKKETLTNSSTPLRKSLSQSVSMLQDGLFIAPVYSTIAELSLSTMQYFW